MNQWITIVSPCMLFICLVPVMSADQQCAHSGIPQSVSGYRSNVLWLDARSPRLVSGGKVVCRYLDKVQWMRSLSRVYYSSHPITYIYVCNTITPRYIFTLVDCIIFPANTKHLYNICTMFDQRRRRWADVVQMLCKCFVFAGFTIDCVISLESYVNISFWHLIPC